MKRLLKQKEEEQERLKKEPRAAQIKKKQLEQRNLDEMQRHKRARNIMEENRVRVAL